MLFGTVVSVYFLVPFLYHEHQLLISTLLLGSEAFLEKVDPGR